MGEREHFVDPVLRQWLADLDASILRAEAEERLGLALPAGGPFRVPCQCEDGKVGVAEAWVERETQGQDLTFRLGMPASAEGAKGVRLLLHGPLRVAPEEGRSVAIPIPGAVSHGSLELHLRGPVLDKSSVDLRRALVVRVELAPQSVPAAPSFRGPTLVSAAALVRPWRPALAASDHALTTGLDERGEVAAIPGLTWRLWAQSPQTNVSLELALAGDDPPTEAILVEFRPAWPDASWLQVLCCLHPGSTASPTRWVAGLRLGAVGYGVELRLGPQPWARVDEERVARSLDYLDEPSAAALRRAWNS